MKNNGFSVLQGWKIIAGHRTFDPLYYDMRRLTTRQGLGIPYYFFERIFSLLAGGHGMNLVIVARRN